MKFFDLVERILPTPEQERAAMHRSYASQLAAAEDCVRNLRGGITEYKRVLADPSVTPGRAFTITQELAQCEAALPAQERSCDWLRGKLKLTAP